MKKRVLSMFLAIAMMFSLAIPAYAEDAPEAAHESEIAAAETQEAIPAAEPASEQTSAEEPSEEPAVVSAIVPVQAEPMEAMAEPAEGDGEPEVFTITFDANGGYFSAPGDTEYFSSVTSGELISDLPADPCRDDPTLSFTGWNFLASGTGDMVDLATFVPNESMVLYAM